MDTLCRLWPDL